MTSLNYVTVTGTFADGSGAPLAGAVTFTPSQTVYSSGVPLVTPDIPLTAAIFNGQLLTEAGGVLKLLATDNAGLALEGRTGFWFWEVSVSLAGSQADAWQFLLPWSTYGASPYNGTADLYQTANTALNGALPVPVPTGSGGTGLSAASLAVLLADLLAAGGGTLGAELSPKVVTLADAATVAVSAAAGNEMDLVLGGNRTIGAPSGPVNGQALRFRVRQPASGGPYSASWTSGAGGYSFGSGTAPALSTAASACDILAFDYDAVKNQWMYLGSATGF